MWLFLMVVRMSVLAQENIYIMSECCCPETQIPMQLCVCTRLCIVTHSLVYRDSTYTPRLSVSSAHIHGMNSDGAWMCWPKRIYYIGLCRRSVTMRKKSPCSYVCVHKPVSWHIPSCCTYTPKPNWYISMRLILMGRKCAGPREYIMQEICYHEKEILMHTFVFTYLPHIFALSEHIPLI